MTKQEAVALFGDSYRGLADALGITRAAISMWPDDLTDAHRDRVIGAAIRLGRQIPVEFLRPVPQQMAYSGPDRRQQQQ